MPRMITTRFSKNATFFRSAMVSHRVSVFPCTSQSHSLDDVSPLHHLDPLGRPSGTGTLWA